MQSILKRDVIQSQGVTILNWVVIMEVTLVLEGKKKEPAMQGSVAVEREEGNGWCKDLKASMSSAMLESYGESSMLQGGG